MKYVYKIVAALGALSILPMIVFLEDIYFKITSTALSAIFYIGQLLGKESITQFIEDNNGVVPEAIGDNISLYDLYSLFSGFTSSGDNSETLEKFEVLISPLITSGIALVLIAICAVVTAILAFVMKDNRKVIYSSIAGIGLSLVFKECFEGVAAPILEGTVSISTLMESLWGSLIGTFDELCLNTSFWFIPAVFGFIILWTVLYNYTLPAKEKKERKLMLGEGDEE
ncbi:MAG: hypothetical protein IJN94_02515 [Clostridia bacterium]|nr:hypothetical protein [Clostridia bacterium]